MTDDTQDTDGLEKLSDLKKYYTVFHGSSEEDVAYAKAFWNSLFLHPPAESRLVAADVTQRLKAATGATKKGPETSAQSRIDELIQKAHQQEMQEEKQKYMAMAIRRDEIMALLKKQREERIKKEMISVLHQPKHSEQTVRLSPQTPSKNHDQDVRDVRELK